MALKIQWPELAPLLATDAVPELGPGPRNGVLPAGTLVAQVDSLTEKKELSATNRELIIGLILLWHDHMDAAHVIGQEIENADGSFLHGLIHRREPDYANAGYWFRRAGRHEAFSRIAGRVTELLLTVDGNQLIEELAPGGEWNSLAMIRACEKAATNPAAKKRVKLLRQIQAIEIKTFLQYLCEA